MSVSSQYCSVAESFFLKSPETNHCVCLSFCQGIDPFAVDPSHFLHEEEAKYLKTLQYEKRIRSYLLGRYCAKKCISQLVNEKNLNKIQIKNGVFNQPVVICDSIGNIQVSIAHSDDVATAVAFGEGLILGIDVEKINGETSRVVERELTLHERDLAKEARGNPEHFFLVLWTAKESLAKTLKTGLTLPLNILEVNHLEMKEEYYITSFTHFLQYHCISWIGINSIFSMTYPKHLDIGELQNGLRKLCTKINIENRAHVSWKKMVF